MAHNKNSGSLRRFAFAVLGRKNGRKLLARIVRKQTAILPPLSFPIAAAGVKRLLLILPPEPLAVLHQMKNIAALKAFFKNAATTLLTEASCTEIAGMIEDVTIVEYRLEEKRLFSASFGVFNRSFKDAADVCCLLTDGEDLPLLYCCGRTAAPLRVGYAGAGTYPFINLHVSPSEERRYLTDRNLVMAETLGAAHCREIVLPAATQTKAEIDYIIRGITRKSPLRPVGIDALYFYRAFGAGRAAEMIKALVPVVANAVYLYADETPDASEMEWLSRFNVSLMHHCTVAQLRALLSHSEVVVTGNTVLFGLAAIFGAKAVGVFTREEIEVFCPKTPALRGIVKSKTMNTEAIKQILDAAVALAGS